MARGLLGHQCRSGRFVVSRLRVARPKENGRQGGERFSNAGRAAHRRAQSAARFLPFPLFTVFKGMLKHPQRTAWEDRHESENPGPVGHPRAACRLEVLTGSCLC